MKISLLHTALLSVAFCSLSPVHIYSQIAVFHSEPIIPLFAKVPSPPASVAAGFKMGVYDPGTGTFSSPSYLTELRSALVTIQQDIQMTSAMLNMDTDATTDAQVLTASRMQDPDSEKKTESMTQQEKIEFATKMQQALAAGNRPMQAEDEDVAETIVEISRITTNLNTNYGVLNYENSMNGKHRAYSLKINEHRLKMQEWEMTEVKKLPALVQKNDVSSGKDPQKIKNIKLASINKQIEFMDQQLKAFSIEWSKYIKAIRPELTKADQKFAGIGYYNRIHNDIFKNTLMSHQSTLLNYVQSMAEVADLLIKETGELYGLKLKVEQAPLTEYESNY